MNNIMLQRYVDIFNNKPFVRNKKETTMQDNVVFDGAGAIPILNILYKELESRETVKVLDYGSGHGLTWHKRVLKYNDQMMSLTEIIGKKLQSFYRYDPAHPLYSKKSSDKFDIILCTDVMEHIMEEELSIILSDMQNSLEENGVIIFSVSMIPSRNEFINGENMHITLKSEEEWKNIIGTYCPNSRILFTK